MDIVPGTEVEPVTIVVDTDDAKAGRSKLLNTLGIRDSQSDIQGSSILQQTQRNNGSSPRFFRAQHSTARVRTGSATDQVHRSFQHVHNSN